MMRFKMLHRVLLVTVIALLVVLLGLMDSPHNSINNPMEARLKQQFSADQHIQRHRVVNAVENEDIDETNVVKENDNKELNQDINKNDNIVSDIENDNDKRSQMIKESLDEIDKEEKIQESKFDGDLDVKEQYSFGFLWGGYVFNDRGRIEPSLSIPVETSLVHSFSPYLEHETARRFVDPPHDQVYFANSPAVKWHNGELVLVARMWLDRERYEPKDSWTPNHFADNWLYTQKYDRHMKPINSGAIMGIPLPKQWWVGDGPIEPRLFRVQGRLFISFNAAMSFSHSQAMDFTIMYDYDQNLPIIPKIKGGTPMVNATEKNDMPRDKHWMALNLDEELYFVHNLDPLRVMKCSLDGHCNFVYEQNDRSDFIFEHHVSHLRGGTPFEPYDYKAKDSTDPDLDIRYYISVAHSTMYKTSNHHRFYSAHLVVLRVQNNPSYTSKSLAPKKLFRIVYVSNDIKIHGKIYDLAPMVRPRWIEDGFIFPVGLLIENMDSLVIGVHVNDFSSVLIRIKGINALMTEVINKDLKLNQNIKTGPSVGYLQKHIHDIMQNITHLKFVH